MAVAATLAVAVTAVVATDACGCRRRHGHGSRGGHGHGNSDDHGDGSSGGHGCGNGGGKRRGEELPVRGEEIRERPDPCGGCLRTHYLAQVSLCVPKMDRRFCSVSGFPPIGKEIELLSR